MTRPLVVLAVALVIVVAALVLLSERTREKPVVRIEKAVSLANLAS